MAPTTMQHNYLDNDCSFLFSHRLLLPSKNHVQLPVPMQQWLLQQCSTIIWITIVHFSFPTGYYCPAKTMFSFQFPCNNGTYNNATRGEDVNACQLCSPGYYCPRQGMPEPQGTCAPGWFCTLGSWSDKPKISGNESDSDCVCPGQVMGGKCRAGTYCPAGSDTPVQCDPGSYCDQDELATVSGDCTAGYYCNGSTVPAQPVNLTTGDICPKGHYCPQKSAYPIPCIAGTFSNHFANHNSSNCLPCTAGSYCSGPGRELPNDLCDEGWYCPEGMTVPQPPGKKCLAGHQCPRGSAHQVACLSGTYQPLPGRGACLVCPAGQYCDRSEAIAEKQSGVNESSHGVVTPKDCPAGFYCPNGTQTAREDPCPVGTFSNTTRVENISECRLCPEGYYCEAENITQPTAKCSPGFYCILGASTPTPNATEPHLGPCPQGTYCDEGWGWPTPCPMGTYGNRDRLPGLSHCTICPPGEFCSTSGLSAPNGSCLAGFYCTNGSQEASPVSQSYGDECPVGHYCPAHSYQPTPCPAGTYNPETRSTNDSSCLPCTAGTYCNSTGLANVTGECYPGFYCTLGASSPAPIDGATGDICPAGSYCPQGSPQHYHCNNGTYTNYTGAAICDQCPEGHYCVNRDRADPCPPGYYCPAQTGADLQMCPAGTYNPGYGLKTVSECTQCDGGKYCLTPGKDAVTGVCSSGYYCRTGESTH